MPIYPGATYREIPRFKTKMQYYDRINLHTAVSNSADIYGTFSPEGASCSHFYVNKTGGVIQYVNTDFEAAADFEGNRSTISIETWDGFGTDIYPKGGLTPAFNSEQVSALVSLITWIYEVHPDIPIRLATDSLPGESSRGLSWHQLGVPYRTNAEATLIRVPTAYADGYLKPGGLWYSTASGKVCPGTAKIAQIPSILARVMTGSAEIPPTPNEDPEYSISYVKIIQEYLNKAGAYGLVVDGDLGPKTVAAIKAFQEIHGLYVDGDPGSKTLSKLKQVVTSQEDTMTAIAKYVDPYPGRISSHYALRRKNPATGKVQAHLGTDIAPVPAGTRNKPVRAFQAGTVVAAGVGILAGRTGNGVIVQHTPTFRTYYGHLDRINVSRGQTVSAGTTLGVGGTTGNVTGVHLHFEMHNLKNGVYVTVDPYVEAKNKYGIILGQGGSAGQVTTTPGGTDDDRRIQTALHAMGFYNGIIDGVNGTIQKNAVTAFQAYVNLVADGNWGALTQARYEALGRPASRVALDVALTPVQTGTEANRNIQKALKSMGLYNGIVDGINGNVQKSAVSEFQRLTGLVTDGNWGALTQAKYEQLGKPASPQALSSALSPNVVLKKGSVRSEVGRVQQALRNRGYSKQIVDNQFGAQTDANVRHFQKAKHLVVDGIVSVGGPTWQALGL